MSCFGCGEFEVTFGLAIGRVLVKICGCSYKYVRIQLRWAPANANELSKDPAFTAGKVRENQKRAYAQQEGPQGLRQII